VQETSIRFKVETRDANRKVAQLERQVRKLEIAVQAAGGTTRKSATGFKAFGQGAQVAGVSAKALGVAIKGMLGPLSLVAGATAAVVGGFKGFVEADKARAAVKTLGVDVKTLEGQLVGVVARTGGLASTNQLLAASYDVASAGFGKAADITKILEASLLGAVGGMTDINTVSDAATSVMNAFGLTTDSVSKIVDGFVQTQNDGKIVVGQYASQIGRVAPIAAAAGVGIDELNAAISTVTAQGVPVESTFSGINQIIASIVKPTGEAAKAAKRLGLDFSSAAIKTKGFGGFLEDVIEKTGGSEVEITKLFGSVDALKALMPLINDDLVKFNKNLDNQKNATGAAGDAADIMGQTVSSQLSQIVNNITTLVRGLDQVLGPAIKGLLDLINSVLTAATAAVAKLTEMFQMNRARTQAREELGGVMGRGTRKADPAAVEARAQEIYEASQAASVAKAVQDATKPPANTILPAGNLTAGSRGKTDAEKAAEALERQKQSANQLLVSLKQKGQLEAASTETQRRELELQFEKENLATRFPLLSEEQLKALRDVLDENYGITDEKRKQKKLDEELAKKAKETADKYKQLGDAIKSNVTNGILDAIEGTKTLGETALGIIKQLARQFLTMGINQGFSALGSTGGILGKLFGGGRASGGTVKGGTSYMVGERGPELFTPGRSGSIAPNSAMGGASVTVNVDASGSSVEGDGPNASQLGKAIGAAVQAELIKQKRPGGLLN
jgi:TP901 family phage tail tape measure protein